MLYHYKVVIVNVKNIIIACAIRKKPCKDVSVTYSMYLNLKYASLKKKKITLKYLKTWEPVKFDLQLGIHVRKITENLAIFLDSWGNVNPNTNTLLTNDPSTMIPRSLLHLVLTQSLSTLNICTKILERKILLVSQTSRNILRSNFRYCQRFKLGAPETYIIVQTKLWKKFN